MAMKILLFALTGFGNSALDALVSRGDNVIAVVTRPSPPAPFPYYPCTQLEEEAAKKGIPVLTVDSGAPFDLSLLEKMGILQPDLAIAATFHRKIPLELLFSPRLGFFNVHPSLLPTYRGPTPTNWAIINGEKKTGVTIHRMTGEFDGGEILCQEEVLIGENETDGMLRKKLANLSKRCIVDVLEKIERGTLCGRLQDETAATSQPRAADAFSSAIDAGSFKSLADLNNLIRGLTPFPGAFVNIGGKRARVRKSFLQASGAREPSPFHGADLVLGGDLGPRLGLWIENCTGCP